MVFMEFEELVGKIIECLQPGKVDTDQLADLALLHGINAGQLTFILALIKAYRADRSLY